jgi:UDP-N-acetylglucosamine diphosphorylase / glucose-1-phosphate thymidylyltransferase / UDP-N-acetylgalactosamine diphosphorylase / glucosamine-1-phosphate N-acetyltransferase / galactosamine-1-phosphate N-acetyltransferase
LKRPKERNNPKFKIDKQQKLMNFILFDEPLTWQKLKPITLTRPIGDIRIGIMRIAEKWQHRLEKDVSFLCEKYLSTKFKCKYELDNVYINASILPTNELVQIILNLKPDESLLFENQLIAARTSAHLSYGFELGTANKIQFSQSLKKLDSLPKTFLKNADEIKSDFEILTKNRVSKILQDPHVVVYGAENVFIEQSAKLKACILNAENGPIYIGENAVIQEGSLIIGPAAINADAMVAFGARIRPNTTLGPTCRVGGEVGNSIFQGFSNKAHDGFLGNSYIGEWCNLGANTNNSNLKNDYKEVKLHDYSTGQLENTGEIFCGTFMGDYTKAGISTMFNTGTVVGVCSNVYGSDFQEKYIPSFSWGGKIEGYQNYRFDKAIEVIRATMARKDLELAEADLEILKTISNQN